MSGLTLELVLLAHSRLAQYAAVTCGVDPERLRITGLVPISSEAAGHWRATVDHVRDTVLANPTAAASALIVDSSTRMLHAAFLSTFPSSALLTALDPDAHRASVSDPRLREVVDYLRAHADEPVGPAEVAAVAGAPARQVDHALRRRRSTTSATELWRARMRGVRQELLATDPVAGSVATIAARWGFADPASFRAAYVRFTRGETPEGTLRR